MHRSSLVLFAVFLSASLQGAILYQQDFTGVTSLDSIGWTESSPASLASWDISNTNNAGGTAPEVQYTQTSSASTTASLTSHNIPLNGVDEVAISFRYCIDYSLTIIDLVIKMQTKADDESWVTQWSRIINTGLSGSPSVTLDVTEVDTLRIRFVLTGYVDTECQWYIDNIEINVPDIYITDDVWTIDEDTLIGSAQMLYVSGNSQINFTGPYALTIEGGVEMIGTEGVPIEIYLTDGSADDIGQIVLQHPSQACLFSHCTFYGDSLSHSNSVDVNGGAIRVEDTGDLIISNCSFTGLDVEGSGGAIYAVSSNLAIEDSQFDGCESADKGGAIDAEYCTLIITDTYFSDCTTANNGAAVFCNNSSIVMDHDLITECGDSTAKSILQFGNLCDVTLDHLTVADCDVSTRGVITAGDSTSVAMTNSIVWNNSNDYAFWVHIATTTIELDYIDYNGDVYDNGDFAETHVINLNPLFAEPAGGDYTLTEDSPCIDAGDPDYLPRDADSSITDLGYSSFYQNVPVIASAADIPDDQGRQLQLVWRACILDSLYTQAQYYVWRQDEIFDRATGVFITDCDQLAEFADDWPNAPVYLVRDDYVWCWVATVPALCRDFYSCVVPTLADSSSAGLNATTCMVTYANATGFGDSNPVSGYSLDNIAPMTPEAVAISRSGSAFTVTWDEVTCGVLNGNAYPEQNGVWYRVYAGDTPDFVADETTLAAVTQDLALVWSDDAECKYFIVVAADQE